LFRGGISGPGGSLLAWIGLIAVVQNVVSSLFNSHLFDFYQGWLYVSAVGIVGGQLQREKASVRLINHSNLLEVPIPDRGAKTYSGSV
jgi:hypothetical protein